MRKILKWASCPLPLISLVICLIILSVLQEEANGIKWKTSPESILRTENNLQMNHFQNDPSPHLSRRVKRDEGSHENGTEDDENNCRELPPKPPKSKSSNAPIDLLKLLNNGSQHMMEGQESSEAILILGNTGSGKTTLTQIIAGNLSRLHAVRTQSGGLVIVDDDNRIGLPSTISRTLVPELVFGENGTAFYDCPGFDDTRGPEKDIAANFFINQIIRKVDRVKLIFLVIHSSVKVGNDRLDFDLMVSHATKFLKDVSNYRNSIGLVVTKVNSYDDGGRFVENKLIMRGIVQFLKIYRDNLRSQMESSSNEYVDSSLMIESITDSGSDTHLQRKLQFVESLLETNGTGKYNRISFSRSPTDCGPLSKSQVISSTKKRLLKLYDQDLQYAGVQPEDFGYTLKDATKLAILSYLTSLNEDVTKGIATIMNSFKSWFDMEYLENGELISKIEKLKRSTAELEGLLTSWIRFGNTANPVDLLKLVVSSLEVLGYDVPIRDRQLIQQQQHYFDFFDELNSANISRAVRDWSTPVEKVQMVKKEDLDLAKGELRKHVSLLSQNVSSEVLLLMNGFMNWFQKKGQNESDLSIKLTETQNVTSSFREVLSRLNVLGDRSNPYDFEAVLIPTLARLGFDASLDFQEYIKKSQDFFKLDDEINPPGINRTVKDWMAPVAELHIRLGELEEKVQFSLTIQKKSKEIDKLMGELEAKGKLVLEKSRMVQRLFGELDRKTDLLNKSILLKDGVIQTKERDNKRLQDELNEMRNSTKEKELQLADCEAKNPELVEPMTKAGHNVHVPTTTSRPMAQRYADSSRGRNSNSYSHGSNYDKNNHNLSALETNNSCNLQKHERPRQNTPEEYAIIRYCEWFASSGITCYRE